MPIARHDRELAKRRIMFVAGEDFYFLAYTMLVLLHELKCLSHESAFIDSRKVAFLADFVGSHADMRLVEVLGKSIAKRAARSRLTLVYDRAEARRAPLERLVEATAHRGLIIAERAQGEPDRIWISSSPLVEVLLRSALYETERTHVRRLRSLLPHLRTMRLVTLKENLFGKRGVRTWGD